MSGLLLACVAGVVVAAWLVFEFTRTRRRPAIGRDQTNLALYQQRRAELEREGIEGAELEALERELDLALVDEFPDTSTASAVVDQAGIPRSLAAGVAIAICAASVALYSLWGEPNAHTLLQVGDIVAGKADESTLEAAANTLMRRVQRRPDDQQSWFYLGYTRFRQGDHAAAAGAFSAVHELAGASLEVDAYWAQARYMASGAEIDATTREIIDRVLAQIGNHPAMLEMLAMDAVKRGDMEQSASYLERALGGSMEAKRRAVFQGVLDEVRGRMDPDRPQIAVDVEFAEGGDHPPWLMVFARPSGGGPPRAVVRRPATGRQTIILDDAASMSPALRLSTAGEVRVVARLSASGTAMSAAGDWQAISVPVNAADRPSVTLKLDAPAVAARPVLPSGHAAVVRDEDPAIGLTIDLEFGAGVNVPGDTAVFVIARTPQMPGPPLAVKRLRARDLPQTVVLGDADTMMPGRRMSDQASVEVVARAAVGGSAAAVAGDFESEKRVVSDMSSGLRLVIDRPVGG